MGQLKYNQWNFHYNIKRAHSVLKMSKRLYSYKTLPKDNFYKRGVINKSIFEDINQVREQIQIGIDDYNNYRPCPLLGKLSSIKQSKFNSSGVIPRRIKNNNFIKI